MYELKNPFTDELSSKHSSELILQFEKSANPDSTPVMRSLAE